MHTQIKSHDGFGALQEEDAEEEGEAQRMAEWDRKAADEAYKTEIERAKRQQEILDEQAAAWVRFPYSLPNSANRTSIH